MMLTIYGKQLKKFFNPVFTPQRRRKGARKRKSSEAITLLSCTNAMEPATGLEPVTPALRVRDFDIYRDKTDFTEVNRIAGKYR
mgnify:CR=1 FL=1